MLDTKVPSYQGRRRGGGRAGERLLPPWKFYQLIICISYCSSINSLFILSRLQSSCVATGDIGPQPQPGPPDSCHTEIMHSFKMQQNRWFSWGFASDPTAGAFTIISRNLSLHYIVWRDVLRELIDNEYIIRTLSGTPPNERQNYCRELLPIKDRFIVGELLPIKTELLSELLPIKDRIIVGSSSQ